jgi:hypothetical protein
MDIRQAPLLRLRVARDSQSARCYVLLQFHHIVVDGMSFRALVAEIVARLEGNRAPLREAQPYREHVAQALSYAQLHDADAFFRSKLSDVDEPTAPFGILDVHGDGTQIDEACAELDAALAQRIRSQARRMSVSSATLFHAAFALVVAHTASRNDVVFGSVLLGRMQAGGGARQMLGLFINTLPLRLQLHAVSAQALVEQTQRALVELLAHEQASLAVAQRCRECPARHPCSLRC